MAAIGFWSQVCACARTVQACLRGWAPLALGLVLLGPACPAFGQADPVKGEVTFTASGGYARMVFKLARGVGSEVTTAGSIVVIRFEQPIDVRTDYALIATSVAAGLIALIYLILF